MDMTGGPFEDGKYLRLGDGKCLSKQDMTGMDTYYWGQLSSIPGREVDMILNDKTVVYDHP